MEFYFVIGAAVLLGLIIAFRSGPGKKNQIDDLKSKINIIQDSITQVDNFYNFISDDSTTKKFKDSSFQFLSESNIDLYEPRARRYAGHSGLRVAKGVYIGGSTAKSYQEMTHLSTGNLTLFVDELVYSSSMETRTLKLANIVDTELFSDGLRVSVKNRQKPSLFIGTNNSPAYYDFIQLLKALSLEFGKSEWNRDVISNTIEDMKSQYNELIEKMNAELKELEQN